MFRGLFRLIFYAIVAYVIYRVFKFFENLGKSSQAPRSTSSPQLQGKMVKDEVCSTYLPQEEALQEIRDGKEYFFCSRECRQKFLEQKKTD